MKLKKFSAINKKRGKVRIKRFSDGESVWTPISNKNSPAPGYEVNIKKVSDFWYFFYLYKTFISLSI